MNNRPWYFFYSNKSSNYSADTFYNTADLAFTKLIEQNYTIIQEEIKLLLRQNESSLEPYFNIQLLNAPNKWKALSFCFWGIPMSSKAIKFCPKTIAIFNQVDNLVSASISVLEPNAEIKPHYGDTDAIYRCHLGLEIPAGIPDCGFRVGYEDRSWENGKLLVFNDAAYHKAWNYTNKRRVILLFDVIRPEFKSNKLWICAMVRGCIIWQLITSRITFFSKEKNLFSKIMSLSFAVLVYFKLSLLNRKSAWL